MILDTSVLYDLVVDGPRHVGTANFLSHLVSVVAPDLIEVEIASALTRSVRRGYLSQSDALASYALAQRMMPEIDPSGPLMDRAFALSLELSHPTPDCVFLALAERRNDMMATADARLVRKLAGTPYARFVQLVDA